MRDFIFKVLRRPLTRLMVIGFNFLEGFLPVGTDDKRSICRAIALKPKITIGTLRVDISLGKVIVESASSRSDVMPTAHSIPWGKLPARTADVFIAGFNIEGKYFP